MDDDRTVEELKALAQAYVFEAEAVLQNTSLGEMDRQIEQCRLMELSCCVMQQLAIKKGDGALWKSSGEQALKWATNMRAATTKRRNDEVPRLLRAMADRKKWARALLDIPEDQPIE